jgi:hypothetical protein
VRDEHHHLNVISHQPSAISYQLSAISHQQPNEGAMSITPE